MYNTKDLTIAAHEIHTLHSALLTQAHEQRRRNIDDSALAETWTMLAKIEDAMGLAPTIKLEDTEPIAY